MEESLAVWKNMIFGGTTIGGGGGSHPTQKEARLFLWDAAAKKVVFETVPAPGETAITGLIVAPNGLLYGVAGRTLFAFDPDTRTVKHRRPLPFTGTVYNAVTVCPDGLIRGLCRAGVFAIDPATHAVTLEAASPRPVTGGFALRGVYLYYFSGPELYRYRLPLRSQFRPPGAW